MRILRLDNLAWEKFEKHRRRVFVRVDLNVPIRKEEVLDDFRIRKVIPTIEYLLEKKCIVVLGAHLGRPKIEDREKFTLLPVAERLAELLKREVVFSEETIGDGVRKLIIDGRPGKSVILLENLRFHSGETKNSADFAENLFRFCDFYINDAFGACHRAHASIEAITHFTRVKAMGKLLDREWNVLHEVLQSPRTPQIALIGGAKIKDKIGVLENLLKRCHKIIVGGRMGLTFLSAQGFALEKNEGEEGAQAIAKRLMADARHSGVKMVFPVDGKAARSKDDTSAQTVDMDKVPKGKFIFDIGPKTLELWQNELKEARSVIWNGPVGVFENPTFSEGTLSLVDFFVEHREKIRTVAGGGETVAAIAKRGALDQFYHISTGGGAMLEFLEGKSMPGIEALKLREREIAELDDGNVYFERA